MICGTISAAPNAHYLPLKSDPLIELELERLATLAKMPVMSKPYHLATVQDYLEKIKTDYPELYRRINSYISRYRQKSNITSFGIEASYSDFEHKNIPNQRGQTSASNFKGEVAGYWKLSDNINLSAGGIVYDGSDGIIPNHTYLSYVHDYFQIDVGYKEVWLSPLQESAMLQSTNAKPIANFSINNPVPITDFNLNYSLAFGKLEKMDGILFEGTRSSGTPGFLSMHVSFQPTNNWTIGASRTMQFGGGQRPVDFGVLWDAIFNPIESDNCGGQTKCNESGNQQAAISTKLDLYLGTPLSIYYELAGEDSGGFRWYSLGNRSYNLGVFFPYMTEKSSVYFEIQSTRIGWYTHHLYEEGYRNEGDTIGHWWGDEKLSNDGIGAEIANVRFNYELSDSFHFDFKYSTLKNVDTTGDNQFDESLYKRSNELTIGLSQIGNNNIWRYEFYTGNDMFGEDFTRVSVKYSWQ